MGLPTMSDRPTTTARRPLRSIDSRSQHLHDPGGGARHEPRPSLLEHSDVDGVEAVDVLRRVDPVEDARAVDAPGSGS